MLTHLQDRPFTRVPVRTDAANDNHAAYVSPYLLQPHVTEMDVLLRRFCEIVAGRS